MRRATTYLAAFTAALAALLAGSAGASGSGTYSYGQNVDPSLVTTITNTQSNNAGSPQSFHVLVFGAQPDLTHADSASGISQRDDLDPVGAQSVTVNPAQLAQLSSQKGIQFVTADQPMAPEAAPPVPPAPAAPAKTVSASALATLYPQIDGAPGLWSSGVTGSGVGVAVIDSGVTPRADFGSRLVQIALPTQDGTALADNVGHGSAVAGVVAGQSADGKYIGVAPGSTVYAINVARTDGVYTSDVIAGLNWVLQNAQADNIRVVNLSLSQTTPSSYYTNTLDATVDLLWKQGIVVVTASGNFGPGSEEFAPANDPWAITVGASDSNDTLATTDDTLAEFSSYGITPDGFSKPDLVAPGRHIVTSIPASSTIAQSAPAGYLVGSGQDNYVRISGTSFSSPQVAGAAALILQAHPTLNPNQVKWVLTQSASNLTGSGAGTLNLGAAVTLLARPGDNGNAGYRWSNWAHPGERTTDFLASIATTVAAIHAEVDASTKDVQAQLSCLKAGLSNFLGKLKTAPGTAVNPAYTDCAQHLDDAAAAWDTAATAWSTAGKAGNAKNDETKSGNDYQTASTDWTKAGNAQNAASDLTNQAAAWDKAAAWDHAAAWDTAAAWDHAAAWDAAAWDKAAAWDHAAAWDAAAWDAAAWDAAAWDAAAWD